MLPQILRRRRKFCAFDDCPGGTCTQGVACEGGPNNGGACTTDADCPGICVVGAEPGSVCSGDSDCQDVCFGGVNGGLPCVTDDDCPGSTCSIGICSAATCSLDKCVGGPNDDSFCAGDDCPSGSCDGPKSCNGGTNADQACTYGCAPSFPAYKNSSQGGQFFTAEPVNDFFADDIRLAIPVDQDNPCMLTSWAVGFKGQLNHSGAVLAELHTSLDPDDPEDGGLIPGTTVVDLIFSDTVRILERTFDPPIAITQRDLFVFFKTSNSFVGPIRTCKQSAPGSTESVYFVHSGTEGDDWQARGFEAGCVAGFEVTLSCAGAPPSGACCDMVLTENRTCIGGSRDGLSCNADWQCRVCIGGSNDGFRCFDATDCPSGSCPSDGEQSCVGDAVCRELPEMNCAFPTKWVEGSHCGPVCQGGVNDGEHCAVPADCPGGGCEGSFCVGGDNDGIPCDRQLDCPSGDCVGQPFDYGVPCGVGACCTVDMGCLDVTEAECHELDGAGVFWRGHVVRRWRPGVPLRRLLGPGRRMHDPTTR